MKKSLLATSILCATFAANAASAQPVNNTWPNWYLGLSGGGVYQADQDYVSNGAAGTARYSEGYNVSGALGYVVPMSSSEDGRIRLEAEVGKGAQDFDGATGTIENTYVAANAFYDLNTGTNVIPYVGAGVGLATITLRPTNPAGANGKDNVPIYQLMTGIGYAPETIPNTELTLGYRYQQAISDPNVDNTGAGRTEVKYSTHAAEVGARLRF